MDMERACALLIGRCLGGMLIGSPLSIQEKQAEPLLSSHLFSNGLQMCAKDLGKLMCLKLYKSLNHHIQIFYKLTLFLEHKLVCVLRLVKIVLICNFLNNIYAYFWHNLLEI